ncbi:MAG: macro domain-containing protein [Candidatus Electrothrix aestuarii]|uniref:Macro domain-containing protein n=1 Tax=Candidatus Electrothrix aestuarii TaxID=3062594 RepID=A0AAU8LWQ9_9BACT|nr:macro domain-containing protein [Candidatus Electrothrix aestuarii]
MSVTFVQGDLFDYDGLDAVCHGCNCAGAMGKGIALEFRKRYPAMYSEYKQKCQDNKFDIGDVFTWKENSLIIFNLGTQKTWRTKATLTAIEISVTEMLQLAIHMKISKIGVPRIGAGLGGLSWIDVKKLLVEIADNYPVELVVFEEFQCIKR